MPAPPYQVRWTAKTGGLAAAEPLVKDGILYFSGTDRRIELFDLATGERRFRKRYDGPVLGVVADDSTLGVLTDQDERRFVVLDLRTGERLRAFRMNSASAPPRRLNDSVLVLGSWGGYVLAMNDAGNTVWKTQCDGPIKSAPAISDSIVYVTGGRSLYALNARDGLKIWSHEFHGPVEGGPALDRHLYVGSADSTVCALDPLDGALVWSTTLSGGVFASPTIGDSLIFVAGNDGSISALRREDGKVAWTHTLSVVANHSPTLCGEFLLATSRSAELWVFRAGTGEKLSSEKLLFGQATAPPVVVGDHILLADSHRRIVCLAPANSTRQAAE
jgi:outer membrane protein assembly factor BamB